ncbi:hypothetical protein D3Z60_20985 [Lachnospiraceae bacterium]|nr:hypothetical protein [Lachnospiraceae bacterium]
MLNLIKIERTQTDYTDYDTNSKIYEESTQKNKTSRRTIVINDFTYKWLMEQKSRQGLKAHMSSRQTAEGW